MSEIQSNQSKFKNKQPPTPQIIVSVKIPVKKLNLTDFLTFNERKKVLIIQSRELI